MNKINHVNQGDFCRLVIQNLVNAASEKRITVSDALVVLRHAGWKTRLDSYRSERKHIYEVLRQARRDGLTSMRVDGDDIFLDDDVQMDKRDETLETITRSLADVAIDETLASSLASGVIADIIRRSSAYEERDLTPDAMRSLGFSEKFFRFEVTMSSERRESMTQSDLDNVVSKLFVEAANVTSAHIFTSAPCSFSLLFSKVFDLKPSIMKHRTHHLLSLDVQVFHKSQSCLVKTTMLR
jgi:hypothetical protein